MKDTSQVNEAMDTPVNEVIDTPVNEAHVNEAMDTPLVSIVIVCMNRLDNLCPCLDSIRRYTAGVSYETMVVAYRFTQENLTSARGSYPWVEFIESNEIRGFSENNNLALKRARGKYCFVVNDDTEMLSDLISQLVMDMERLPEDAAIVSPKILNADGSLQLCGRPEYPARFYVLQQWHMHKEPIDDTIGKKALFDSVFRTSNITGAAFLIKTGIFHELGWFDEKYFFTPEDIALSTLTRKRGYGVYVDSGTSIIHKWRTTASGISPAVRPAAVRGSLMFFSNGSSLKYLLLGIPVWLAESSKAFKAFWRYKFSPTQNNRIKMLTFKNIASNIFTRKRPKDIFKKYYNG